MIGRKRRLRPADLKIIATHSPLLLACPDAVIYSFDGEEIEPIRYEQTEHYRIYKSFLEDRDRFI